MTKEIKAKMTETTKNKKNFQVNKYVCQFIMEEWLSDGQTLRKYGKTYGVNYHVIEKIIQKDGYNLPLHILSTMCFNRGIKLSDFFSLVEEKYGDKLNDHFYFKSV